MQRFAVVLVLSFAFKGMAGTVDEAIIKSLHQAKTFAEFVNKAGVSLLPGDQRFLRKIIEQNQDLLKDPALPALSYTDTGYRIEDIITIQFQFISTGEVIIGDKRMPFRASKFATQRWKDLAEALKPPENTTSIFFMPVAFAQSNGVATKSLVTAFMILSRVAANAVQAAQTKMEDLKFVELYEAAIVKNEKKCSIEFLSEYARALARLEVSEVKCQGTNPKDIQFLMYNSDDDSTKKINLLNATSMRKGKRAETMDAVSFEWNHNGIKKNWQFERERLSEKEQNEYGDGSIVTLEKAQIKPQAVEQMFKWLPIESKDPVALEAAEQFRELANHGFAVDFCGRCMGLINGFAAARKKALSNPKIKIPFGVKKKPVNPEPEIEMRPAAPPN